MSYDFWLLPAEHCHDAAAARAFALTQDEADEPATSIACSLAADISAVNADLTEEQGFLSVTPLSGTGAAVFVPSPWRHIQDARDVVVPRAFAADYGMYDPQLDIVLSPRGSVAGRVSTSREGTFPTITPDLIDHFVGAMKVDDFVIVETRGEVYIQTTRINIEAFTVEHRAGSADQHFGTEVVAAPEVVGMMKAWLASDGDAITDQYSWTKIDL
ncbi:hypothetical protein [Rhodococcus sp. OK302]|uniref:hypothetical protein n=1 Tax=Rhodococcus sp. OK302 TaxID=1882769 RepID=UPI000B9417B7|nr:hypothetical protein [Rhodococcus sp. OK302]OYD61002.1 hypothetical protein BDB13_5926 [Rhodococcus sp. OK302]